MRLAKQQKTLRKSSGAPTDAIWSSTLILLLAITLISHSFRLPLLIHSGCLLPRIAACPLAPGMRSIFTGGRHKYPVYIHIYICSIGRAASSIGCTGGYSCEAGCTHVGLVHYTVASSEEYACSLYCRRLRHGNLVQLRAASCSDKLSLYIVMEKCPLGSLFSRIKEVRAQSHLCCCRFVCPPVQDDLHDCMCSCVPLPYSGVKAGPG